MLDKLLLDDDKMDMVENLIILLFFMISYPIYYTELLDELSVTRNGHAAITATNLIT